LRRAKLASPAEVGCPLFLIPPQPKPFLCFSHPPKKAGFFGLIFAAFCFILQFLLSRPFHFFEALADVPVFITSVDVDFESSKTQQPCCGIPLVLRPRQGNSSPSMEIVTKTENGFLLLPFIATLLFCSDYCPITNNN
jgi:hypothetical protein